MNLELCAACERNDCPGLLHVRECPPDLPAIPRRLAEDGAERGPEPGIVTPETPVNDQGRCPDPRWRIINALVELSAPDDIATAVLGDLDRLLLIARQEAAGWSYSAGYQAGCSDTRLALANLINKPVNQGPV